MKEIITKRERVLLLIHFLFILIIATVQTAYPILVSSFINDKTMLKGIVWLIALFIIGKVLISVSDILLNSRLYWDVFSKLRSKLVSALIEMDYAEIIKREIGELTQTIENDSEQLLRFYLMFLTTLIKNGLFVLGVLVVGLCVNIWIGLLLLTVLVALFFAFRFINTIAQSRWEKTKNEYQEFFGLISKVNSMMNEMLLLHQETYLKNKVLKAINTVFNADFMSSLISYNLWISTIFGFGFTKVIVLLIGVLMKLNLGVVYLFVYYIDLLNDPIEELRIQLENIPSTPDASRRLDKLLSTHSSMGYGMTRLDHAIRAIELHKIAFSYGTKDIFKEFSMMFEAGKVYGLFGKSGSGKSTLINLIARLYDAKEGIIKINEIHISDFQKGELSKQMEYIGQNEMAELSNYEIVDPNHLHDKKEIEGFLGYSLDAELSMGQYQYLYLCRALLSEKSVLMLDEIFTHLDGSKIKKGFDVFKQKGQLVIIITHEKEVMRYCDKLVDLGEYSYAI